MSRLSSIDAGVSKFTTHGDWSKALNLGWKRTTESMMLTARLCFLATKKHSEDWIKDLTNELIFSASTFSMMAQIGEQEYLYEEPISSLLPPRFTVVYEAQKRGQKVIEDGLAEGVISPAMTLPMWNRWLIERYGPVATKENPDPNMIKTILLIPNDKKFNHDQLLKLLREQGCKWSPPKTGIESTPDVRRATATLVRLSKQAIKELKVEAFRKAGTNPDARKRAWPYEDKAVEVGGSMGWGAISSVFDEIGHPNLFGHVLDEVLALHSLDDPIVRQLDPRRQGELMQEAHEARKKDAADRKKRRRKNLALLKHE
jgi:hypothetical protein